MVIDSLNMIFGLTLLLQELSVMSISHHSFKHNYDWILSDLILLSMISYAHLPHHFCRILSKQFYIFFLYR